MYATSDFLSTFLLESLSKLPQLPKIIAVAVSGGIDSSTLAIVSKHVADKLNIDMVIFHVNHGLQEKSDYWANNVHLLAKILNVEIYEKKVFVNLNQSKGMEGSARIARYRAFKELSESMGIKYILLAHHLNDQAETVLLRLLRGSGVKGMVGMRPLSRVDSVFYIRPWLKVDKKLIELENKKFSLEKSWFPVDDPTNKDPLFSRGVVRLFLEPVLDKYWPQWKKTFSRHAMHMFDADLLLDNIAHNDLNEMDFNSIDFSFSLMRWRELEPKSRQVHVLRYWFFMNGLKMPSQARLDEIYKQLKHLHALGYDRRMKVQHDGHFVLCDKGRVYIKAN
ncbi:tRNA(Ile)-lysidine synthase [Candidatus Kinetoplastibacterium desouzaii TCC079E]|uniref:tRNA(Ile)-lysidine synthase n=1 Tax=Candidatus Kinetoplastidibacterium desouzai TCC079E TaxID=1208919 RepID=M1LLV8_9PROT|nr:tRNA lysidine(34) synthetase TilS [Candidatus Kinetoplastibacterium desouzaii]AGF46722.1 tRNA(Ile)-lysidine synthase [Candidatus Kinetoplastibacterium desouzaii TCC079E]